MTKSEKAVFVVLKALEACGVVFVPYWIARICIYVFDGVFNSAWHDHVVAWLFGVAIIGLTTAVVVGVFALASSPFFHHFITLNKNWSAKIVGRFRK